MRVGIVKGAFAPLLRSSVKEVLRLRKVYQLQEIWFVLDKEHEMDYTHRLRMTKMMIDPYRKLKIQSSNYFPKEHTYVELTITESSFVFEKDWKELSSCVKNYMMEQGLYIEDIAKSLVKPKRWLHVQSMTALAVDIAKAQHVNAYEAFVAGMFHDCTKRWDYEYSCFWMRFCAPEAISEAFAIHHQYTGYAYAKRILKIRNKEENIQEFQEKTIVEGTIKEADQFKNGLFIELKPNLVGLAEYKDGFKYGQKVNVYIKKIIKDKKKIKLLIV